MKNVKVYNKQNQLISDQNHYENPEVFVNHIVSTNYFGLPERWVQAKELIENGNLNEPEHWMWHSEYYENSDILQTEERNITYIHYQTNEDGSTIEIEKERIEIWILLKAEYTIEIIDLDQNYDWLLSECHRKRREEYPPLSELGDALYWKENGDSSKYKKYITKCDEVKKKYPLPIKEEIV